MTGHCRSLLYYLLVQAKCRALHKLPIFNSSERGPAVSPFVRGKGQGNRVPPTGSIRC